ncbi:MAG TPA: hypothetical protein VMS21_04910 [Methylomirabilota bacterium]|nr:hypothetical protein [Methylomirabilota bacterium]
MNPAIANRKLSLPQTCWAGLLALAILLLPALAAWPTLHDHVHEDASDAGHHCAVTLFSKGQIDLADTFVPVPFPVRIVPEPFIRITGFIPGPDHLFSQGRAPPLPLY